MARWETQDRINYLTVLCRTVPHHIVEAVLRDPCEQALQSVNAEGSLLFADLVGFTAMCERLVSAGSEGLSALGEILSGVFDHLLEDAIFPYRGYVIHFGGDSVTTVFRGADHARRAAAAALTANAAAPFEVLATQGLRRARAASGRSARRRPRFPRHGAGVVTRDTP